jgi:DNA-binding response OmpR family regulator
MKILLVSGNDGARAWIRGALGSDWAFAEARDGNDALEIARDETPDIVITDDSTEPFGGFGLARELKILPQPPRVIVLLQRAQDAWLARWSGADRWLLQPIDPVELERATREVLEADVPEGAATDADVGTDALERTHAAAGTPYTEAQHTDRPT